MNKTDKIIVTISANFISPISTLHGVSRLFKFDKCELFHDQVDWVTNKIEHIGCNYDMERYVYQQQFYFEPKLNDDGTITSEFNGKLSGEIDGALLCLSKSIKVNNTKYSKIAPRLKKMINRAKIKFYEHINFTEIKPIEIVSMLTTKDFEDLKLPIELIDLLVGNSISIKIDVLKSGVNREIINVYEFVKPIVENIHKFYRVNSNLSFELLLSAATHIAISNPEFDDEDISFKLIEFINSLPQVVYRQGEEI